MHMVQEGENLCTALESLGIQSADKGRQPLRGMPVPQVFALQGSALQLHAECVT